MISSPDSRYLDIKQFSATAGLSIATIRRLARDGRIPYFQPAGKGGKLLFPPDALELAAQGANCASAQPQSDNPGQPEQPGQSGQPGPGRLSGRVPRWMQDSHSEN
jgi:hypothetical protein